ncbi:MAG TPA: ABC transporter permease, partial [Gemmatimonadales bacterium]|nr:ABC transporter permease [Gemmatimonadales bacterium]
MSRWLALRLFRLAARAFPKAYRARWQDEMSATFRQVLGAQPHPLRYALRASADAIRAGLRERLRAPTPSLPTHQYSRTHPMGTFWQDVRYAFRSLWKSPGFSAVAVLTIGLGLGANTAIFSVLDTALLRPLPFREPERLVSLWESRLDRGFTQTTFSRPNFWDMKDQQRTLEGIAAMENSSINLTGRGFPTELALGRVSANFFRMLGVTPYLGRTFAEGEDAPGAGAGGVLLSFRAWKSWGGADREIVGKPLTLNDRSYTV